MAACRTNVTCRRFLGCRAVAMALVLVSCSHSSLVSGSTGESAVAQPPPQAVADYYLAIDIDRVPAEGGVLHLRLRSTVSEGAVFGVSGTLDRWNGATWVKVSDVVVGLEMWGPDSVGTLQPQAGPGFGIPSIGLTALKAQDGPNELLEVTGLAPGWFRVCQPGSETSSGNYRAVVACTQFEVVG